jgi:hypothetical protein
MSRPFSEAFFSPVSGSFHQPAFWGSMPPKTRVVASIVSAGLHGVTNP